MSSEEYARHFTNVPERVLLELVDDPADNDPVAVQAAQDELLKRDLSEAELAALRAERSVKEERGRKRGEKVGQVKIKAQAVLSELGHTIMADPSPERNDARALRIMIIVIGIMLLAVSHRFFDLRWLVAGDLRFSTVEYFLPLVILPITFVLLWKKNRTGWFISAAVTAWTFAQALLSGYLNWDLQPSGIDALDSLFPIPSEPMIIGGVLFSAALMVAFQARRSLLVFSITEKERWWTSGLAVALSAWMMLR